MDIFNWQQCSATEQKNLLMRPAIAESETITQQVSNIIDQVRKQGDQALTLLTAQFDRVSLDQIKVNIDNCDQAALNLSSELKQAIQIAATNIRTFHQAQKPATISVETMPGIECHQVTRPIESVGLYIPGGTAPLLSTVLMLAIPAKIAGCNRIILCSPPPISDEILYAARLCGITDIYQIGGAQAIAAMAFGTESVPKVNKIFGPGNAFVTEAKRQISQCKDGANIDMPAGPSEVLVIADSLANPAFIAIDLLSQAEHGADSQVILVTPDQQLAEQVKKEIDKQIKTLPRQSIAEKALIKSRLIVTKDLEQCIAISNQYGPEHLIIQTRNASTLVEKVTNAGSIFLGDWSPESVGDYASGTNHVLPTYGYTATYSSLGLADFQKRMTVQQLSPAGLLLIAPTVEIMAQAEQLTAHKQAVTLRVQQLMATQA